MTANARPTVVVIGSVHTDLIAGASRMPGPGDSVTGTTFVTAPGGKAANQACQIARCGIDVALIGNLGDDHFGAELRAGLEAAGVGTRFLTSDPDHPTGTSTVLAAAGEYASIIVPGAAAHLTASQIDAAFDAIERPVALVLQLELPVPIVTYAATRAEQRGVRVVLNASPVPDEPESLPAALWRATDILVVNRAEATRLVGGHGADAPAELARTLASRYGVGIVVVTLGPFGAVIHEYGSLFEQLAFPAKVVDSIGAGDAFLGALVAGLVAGRPLAQATRRAAAAGAIAVGGRGALDSMPTGDQIDEFLRHASPTPFAR